MGLFSSTNHFPVDGKTVLITGGSQGAGRETGQQLSAKGASIAIVARRPATLEAALSYISSAARSPSQRFTSISADLSQADECARVIREATAWNGGRPPDVVWCSAGGALPTLFADTAPERLKQQMDANFFTAAYVAHAALNAWLGRGGRGGSVVSATGDKTKTAAAAAAAAATTASSKDSTDISASSPTGSSAHHLILTSSFLALYPIAGYAPYTPAKSALRGLADTLSMEVELYNHAPASSFAAGLKPRPIRIHALYPATIYSEGFELEQAAKSDLTKRLEEDDTGQSSAEVARKAILELERGRETLDTDLQQWAVRTSVMGGSRRGSLLDWMVGVVMVFLGVMGWVRWDMDRRVKKWAGEHGPSGMKRTGKE